MSASERPEFRGGVNIAMKIPPHQFAQTERFYVEVLGLPVLSREADHVCLEFGPNRLWLDRVAALSQAEIWLEVVTPDGETAAAHLAGAGVPRCDAIETLPEGFPGFWIASPAQIVHLVVEPGT